VTGQTAVMAEIRQRLTAAFAPTELEVIDDGHLHIGHAAEGKGHFRVRIVATAFAGVLPVKRHQMVYAVLADMMDHGIHALSIDAK
jgi:BolA protein